MDFQLAALVLVLAATFAQSVTLALVMTQFFVRYLAQKVEFIRLTSAEIACNKPSLLKANISLLKPPALLPLIFTFAITGCATQNCGNNPVNHWSNQSQLLDDIRILSSKEFEGRKTATHGAELSREYIKQRFSELNLTPWQDDFDVPFTYRFNFSNKQGINVIATIKAQNETDRWRVITAHYDHLGKKGNKVFAGADDNASGVAAMLAIAEQWHAQGNQNVNLMLVATDAEETGLFGSYALVEQLMAATNMQVEMSLNLDMIGNPSRPKAIYVEGEKNLTEFNQLKTQLQDYNQLCIRESRSRMKNGSMVKIDWLRASDHYPFHKVGIPWLYLGVPTHKQYHTIDDTIDTIDIGFLAAVTETAFELVSVNKQQIAFQ
ncbi:M20/M25/M40 family metallo-hydrolase [Shewanella sp. KT0246]|uniref:M20/M25/M40 family metallo-hydrolase n=1 Tax=Shewanella sp. KT0246 TaxID=2815912 RepID=UPI001BB955E9|nr:M20/M25/M40 family metallo-hydrolase [Shewanella sp. KT0246]GIU52580.1 peptidase M28 [Shewanella sp. KT0246]